MKREPMKLAEAKHYWEAICPKCDKATDCVEGEEKPTHSTPSCGWCDGPTEWTYVKFVSVAIGRMSGFSTSESDFTPHWNTATGEFVQSLAQMKHLQASKGLEDVAVTGRGEKYIPRDWLTRPDRERREAEKAGVRVSFED